MHRRLLGIALLLVTVIALGSSGLAVAQPEPRPDRPLVVATDPGRDAHFTGARGMSRSDRRSIDVSRLVVTREGRFVRFAVRLDHVLRAPRVAQIFMIDIMAKGFDFTQLTLASHSLTSPSSEDGLEHEITTEGSDTPQGFVSCNLQRLSYRDGAHRWWVEVPLRCLPQGRAQLQVYAQTVDPPESDGYAQYSEDTLRVPGRHDLGGTIRPGSARP